MKTKTMNSWMAVAASGAMALLMQTSSPAATLVSRYSFNETSGTSAHDSVGSYTATLNGAAAFNGSGQVVLNGASGAYVSLPPAQLSGLTAITIDAWFSFTVPNNNVHLFSVDDGGGTGSGGSYLRYNVFDSGNGNGGTNFYEGIVSWGGNVLHGSSRLPTNNTPVHVTLVYDPVNSVKSIYVNGVLSSTYSGSLAALNSYPQNVFTLGRSPWAAYGDLYLKGSINEFRVYSGVLSDSEIAANDSAGPDSIPQITVGLPQLSPTNTVYAGEPAVLSCAVAGPANGYHWEWDNGSGGASFSRLSGANSLTYTQATTGLLGSYEYQFVATNSSASVTSAIVTLTVNAATAPFVTSDTAPSAVSRYTGATVTFTAAFDGNHPITYQWQVDKGSGFTNIVGATNTSLALTSLQLSDAGNYRLAATNSIGDGASTPATLTVNDVALAKYNWQAPVPFNGLNADRILTNVAGSVVGAAAFGSTAYLVTLGNGRILDFSTDGSIATVTGAGTATGTYPAGTGLTTSNANFDAVLNHFSYDGGPKTISLNNLSAGQQYSVQLFALDDRNLGGGESNRLASFQDPNDSADVSATFKMGDDVYVVGTFWASNTTESIQMNLPTGNNGSINALVLRSLSFVPPNQPPTVRGSTPQTTFQGHPASFAVTATSYVVPAYQWQAGPAGGPYTNLSNGGILSGVTSNILTLANGGPYAGAEFRCVVSNPAGSVESAAGLLTVVPVPPSSGIAGTAVLSLGPVAYWPLNETNDPSAGGVGAYDAAGTYDGAYLTAAENAFNGVTGIQAADGFGLFATNPGALGCSGVDQDWVVTPPLNLNTNTVTISLWIHPNGVQANSAGLFVNRNSGTVAGLSYYDNDRLGYKWNNDGSETWSFNSGLLILTDVWSFVALVVEPTQATLYLYNTNGLQSASNLVAHNTMSWGGNEADIRLGCNNNGTLFNGRIDEVAVFKRALTAAEILQLTGTVKLQAVPTGGQLQLTWPYGTLLQATSLSGPWTTNSATSPYLVTPLGPREFYRVRVP